MKKRQEADELAEVRVGGGLGGVGVMTEVSQR